MHIMKQMGKIGRTILIIALLCTFITTASAYELTYQAAPDFTATGIETIETTSVNPWILQEDGSLKSGNSGILSSVSALKVTVTGSGALSFQYKVSSPLKTGDENPNDLPEEDVPDSLLISAGTEVTTDIFYPEFSGQRYYGEIDWQTGVVSVNAENGQQTDIFFGFIKDGNSTNGISDCAWIKDLAFSDGKVTVTAVSTNEAYGTVSGSGEYDAGASVTLTAVPAETGKFYGWQQDGKLVGEENTYTFVPADDSTVTAIFGDPTVIVAQNRTTGAVYRELSAALDEAKAGQTVMQLADVTLSTDTVIKAGVTLYVPYSDVYDNDGNKEGTTASSTTLAKETETYRRLTVADNTTLTVKGSLLVGGVIGYPSQYYQGHTSGAHGRVTNNGTILIPSGGLLDTWGFVDGSGSVITQSGGTVKEPFIVFDFAGGSNTLSAYNANQSPFVQYTMQNVRCTLEINAGGRLTARCNLVASGGYNRIDSLVVGGPSDPQALLLLSEGATLTRTVDMSKTIENTGIRAGYGADLGQVTYHITGGADFDALSMVILIIEVNTYGTDFPIPYCWRYELNDGVYSIPYSLKLMPGAEMYVAQNAELRVGPNEKGGSTGKFYVLDGFDQSDMSGKSYPTTEMLKNAGFSQNGSLVVDGKLTVSDGGHFGGIVQTNGTGRIVTGANVSLSDTIQTGYTGAFDDNTVLTAMPARVYNAVTGTLTQLTADSIYTGSAASYTLESYSQLLKAVNATAEEVAAHPEWRTFDKSTMTSLLQADYSVINSGATYHIFDKSAAPVAYASPLRIVGAFASTSDQYAVSVTNKTHYDAADTSRAVIEDAVLTAQNTISFTVTPASGYVSLVQYKLGAGGTLTTLTKGGDGRYLIEAVSDDVTIVVTSVLKGDANLNGKVNATDATAVMRYVTDLRTLDELGVLAADANQNGKVNATDATRIMRYATGLIQSI